jgi:hypothetical protein
MFTFFIKNLSKDKLIDIYFSELKRLKIPEDFKEKNIQKYTDRAVREKISEFTKIKLDNKKSEKPEDDKPEGEKSAMDLLSAFEGSMNSDDDIREEFKTEIAAIELNDEEKKAIVRKFESELVSGLSVDLVHLVLAKLKETKPKLEKKIISDFIGAISFWQAIKKSGKNLN